MRRWGWIIGVAWLCVACQPSSTHTQAYVFGTMVDIQIDDVPRQDAQRATSALLAHYQALHQRLHAWAPSELTQLNQAVALGRAPFRASPTLSAVLQEATQLSAVTDGLFNPAIGKLVALWGFHQETFQAKEIDTQAVHAIVHAAPQMADLAITPNGIISRNPAVQLDLGGMAKGLALDEGRQLLMAHGIRNALINIGGNVIALGQHQGRPWRVGIQHPRQAGALAALDLADGWAIGTSGDYQRYYLKAGVRVCHVINPITGYPANASQSATVLIAPQARAGVLSDVASKPLFIAPQSAANYARKLGVTAWLLVDASGKLTLNQAMQSRLTWLIPTPSYQVVP